MYMIKDIRTIIRSIRFGFRGLLHAYRLDRSFRMEVKYGFPIYLVVGIVLAPFEEWEIIVYVFSYLLILIVELINTAFETMLARVHPEEHDMIGKSKDVSASAVLLAFVFALVVVGVLLYARLPFFLHGFASMMV